MEGERDSHPRIRNPSFIPWLLYPQRNSSKYQLDWRLEGTQNQSGHRCPYHKSNLVVQPVSNHYTDSYHSQQLVFTPMCPVKYSLDMEYEVHVCSDQWLPSPEYQLHCSLYWHACHRKITLNFCISMHYLDGTVGKVLLKYSEFTPWLISLALIQPIIK